MLWAVLAPHGHVADFIQAIQKKEGISRFCLLDVLREYVVKYVFARVFLKMDVLEHFTQSMFFEGFQVTQLYPDQTLELILPHGPVSEVMYNLFA
jgi:hypothetical protein